MKLLLALMLGLIPLSLPWHAMAGEHASAATSDSYVDNSDHAGVLTGGVQMIPIDTPAGTFRVWTKRTGNNPDLKVLLLHGGPGATHDYFEVFDSFFPGAGIEYYSYDQLGAGRSDHPEDDALWTIPRFVEEVEQVRKALQLGHDNFCLLGHSWGGILAIEYALKYQQNLKCLVISNMMASIPAYNEYASKVLMPAMDPEKLALVQKLEAEHQTDDPRYMQTLIPMHYEKHILRMPAAEWPEPARYSFDHINQHVYQLMQGPSELGASGRLAEWDRFDELAGIKVPTLVIGAKYDTMDPKYMRSMAERLPEGRFLLCPQGSHMAMYDDQQTYFDGLIDFLHDIENITP